MPTLRKLVWQAFDCVFPIATPPSPEEAAAEREKLLARTAEDKRLVSQLPSDHEQLASDLASVKELLDAERDRRQSVEARLTTMIGLSSIAGTIVIGTILSHPAAHGVAGLVIPLVLLYLAAQVCSAILAAVIGLNRRGYLEKTAEDVLPDGTSTRGVHLRNQIETDLEILRDDRELNSAKVTQMAVAHRAMKQFVVFIGILALLGTLRSITTAPQDELIGRLRNDRALQNLLRGPQGAPGAQGVPCAPGVTAPIQPGNITAIPHP